MNAVSLRPRVAIIADDEELGRELLASTATAAGLTPLTFENGADALAAALENDVGIVLLDVDMPAMDGYAVCRRLRSDARFASIPIVIVTGHEDPTAIGLAFDAGATDFISKPVNWALLPRRLAYILRNSAAAERIEGLAYFDTLTGLANRSRCIETAEQQFVEAASVGESVAIIYMDLNGFKKINDTFGHGVGDAVLKTVADILRVSVAAVRSSYGAISLARFGGDEFVLMVRHAAARAAAGAIAQICADALKDPIAYENLEFFATPSIGFAVYPDDGTDVATVLKHADVAMYQAKQGAAGSIVAYTASMSARLRDWFELEARLRKAVQNDRLHLHYQPKFSMENGGLVGVEALLRWCDPEFGEIPPVRFIEIAEDSGLIIELGRWVMRAACRQIRDWRSRRILVPVAINVSGKDLVYGDPAQVLEREAADAGIPTSSIEIEITESLLVNDTATVREALERFRRLGCKIALDDFGTGYSSLAYITRFPPDRIKIDKAFVHHLGRSSSDAAVANAILSLGESLGVIVTAEGIERPAQLEWLRRRGCHEAQGFLLSRPLSAVELEARYFSTALQDTSKTLPALRPVQKT